MKSTRSSLISRYSVAFILCLTSLMILMASALSVSPNSSSASSTPSNARVSATATPAGGPIARTMTSPPPLPPVGPALTATKTDNTSLAVDPGATIMYTVVITSTGTTDATNVIFTDTIDSNTTLSGVVASSPIAFDDTFTASGNIPIAPASGLLANDIDPDTGTNAGLTVSQVQGSAGNVGNPTNTTATGIGGVNGSVTVAANGTFTYQPPPGFTGDDTFTYQITDASLKTGTGSVKITVSNMVWFIDNTSAAANSRGTFTEPFKTIAAFNAVNTSGVAPNPQNGHHVVVRPASGSYAEADGINLRDSQTLTGPAVAFNTVFTANANSTSAYNTFAAGTGTAAAITATAGNGVDLGSGNALRGFNIGNTPAFFGVNGAAVGALTVATVSKTGTGGAISVSTSGTFGATVNFGTLESSSSATNNLNLVGVTGTLAMTSPGTGFTGSAAANAAINISGGSVGLTYTGNVTKATTGALLSVAGGHTGTLTFNTGTLNASSGTGLQFDNADGAYNFNGTTTLNGGDAGVDILNGSSGTFSFGSSTTITSPSGTAFNVGTSPGNPIVTYSGNITQSTASQRVVNIDGTTGNTITFQTGTITGGASSTGVNLNAVTGNVTFSNGMTMGTSGGRMTNTAVTINTGSAPAIYDLGVVSIFTTGAAKGIVSTNTGGEIRTSATSVVNALGAAAIDISAAASTPLLMTFTSVTANGGTNGIRLLKTTGSFTVTGDGASDPANTTRGRTTAKQGGGSITLGSGGTINNMTGPAVSLSTASNVTLRNLSLTGNAGGVNSGGDGINAQTVTTMTLDNVLVQSHPGNDGLFGSGVSALTMQHTDIHSNATTSGVESPDVWNVRIDNLTGTSAINNSLFFDSFENIFFIQNAGASNLTLTVTNSEFRDTSTAGAGNVGFGLSADGTCVTTLTATGSKFSNTKTNGFQYAGVTSSSGTVKVQNSTFDQCGVDVNIAHQSAGQTLTYEVSGNTMRQTFKANCSTSTNIFLGGLSTAGTLMTGTVKNNIIGNAGVANSGSDLGAGIGMNATGAGTLTGSVTGNTVVQVRANSGNVFDAGILNTSKLNLNMQSNTFNGNPAQVNPQYGVHINNGSGSPGETGLLCWKMSGNTVTMPASAIASIDLDAFPGTSSSLVGYAGAANNSAQIIAFFSSTNTSVTPSPLYTAAGGSTQAAIAPCSTFVFPTFVTPDLSAESANPVSDGPQESAGQTTDALRATWGESANSESAERLNPPSLSFVVQAAIERWRQAGISSEDLARLQAVSFETADLPGDLLARSSSSQVRIDQTAAGYGWYFDEFPMEDSEFPVLVPQKELQTNEMSPANGKVDLLTVVMRELGQIYMQGQTRVTKSTRQNLRPLMEDTLSPGVRRMPLQLLRITPLSPIGSTLGPVDKRMLAQSNSADQPEATVAGIESAIAQPENDTVRFGQARYATLNSAAMGTRLRPTPAMMTTKNTGGASSAADRARRVGSASPFSGETVTVNGSGAGFTLPVGKSVTIMFSVTVNAANTFPPGTIQVCNQGFVSATSIASFGTTDPGPPVVNGPTCTQLNVADVSVTKAAGSGTTCSTSNIVYTIGYHNAGPASALAVVVSDPMPAGTSLVSAPAPANWTRTDSVPVGGNGTIMFSRTGPSPNGESQNFTVTVSIDGTVTDGTVLSNTASVTSTTPDPNTANNTSSPATTVTVKRPPTPATVGGPQTICALGTTTALGGNTPTIGIGTWTVQSGGTGTFNPNATTPGATFTHLTGTGPIVVRWTISNPPCLDSFAEVTITVRAQPTATVGGPQTICALGTTATLGGNTPTPPATGTWSIVTAGVVGTFNPNATTPGATFTHTSGAIGSTVTLRWTVSNAPCTDATADVVVTIKSQPTATAGGPQTICALGTTTSLGGNTPAAGETGTWSIVTAGVTGTFNPNATTPGATFTHATGGIATTITLRWSVTNAPCTAATADVLVTIKSQPVATVGGPQTICQGGTTATLGGNTPPVGATGTWSIVTGGVVGTFNPNATTPGATFTHTSGAIGSTVTLRWTVSNSPCTDATADVVVTIKSQPTATAGGPQTICTGGTTAALGGNTPPVGATGTWSIVTAGITGTFNPNATTPGATFTHSTGATSPFVLRWTVTNAPCTSATADVTITLQPAPISTNGGPQTVCENGTTAGLGGNTPIAGETGTWSIVTVGATGTFTPNATTPNATFSPTSGAGTITLRWTVSNATCGATATSDVIVTVKLQPTATVGGPQTICALGTTASLGGNTPAGGGTGMWSVVGGGTGTFNPNATTPGATFTHATGTGPITLRWTVSNAPCANATADVVITITPPPTTATVGGPQTICQSSTTASLGGNAPTTGAGMWTIQTGGATGTFNPNATTPGATFTPTSGPGTIVVRWTISNPPCTASFAEVTITVKQQPTSTVGGPQTICALGTTASLGGNNPAGGATGLWTIVGGGTGTFNPNATTPGATFTHATGTGPITVRWTVSNAPCTDATADVVITITQSPTPATVGGPQTICALSTTAGLGGNTPTSGTGTWTVQSGGTGTFNPNASTPNATFTHATGTGPIVLRWTIASPPCTASFAEVTITITQSPTPATVGGPQTICALSTTAGLGGNTPASGAGTWTVQSGGAGTFNPNATTGNATFTHTSGAGPIVLRWTITNAPCPASFAEVTITITQSPTPATVGGPQTICALSTTAGLGGNTPTSGTGTWTIQSGGAGTFSPNASTGNATFTHTSGAGPIVLRWTIAAAPCTPSFAEVTITITQSPTPATVGGPQTICALSTTAGLGGNTPASGAGMWTVQSGGAGTFSPNATTGNATFTHTSGAGPIVLRWTITNAPCPPSFAEVTITITQSPTPATVGGPQTICALSTTTGLGGNTPTSGTGTWTIQSGGAGTFSPNANTGNATFTHTSGAGPIVLRWTIANAPCPASFAEVTITITQGPTPATVGGAQTICEGSATAGLGGNTPSSGIGTWTIQSGGTGTFNPNANTGNATFTPTSGAGTYVVRWTIANPPCPNSFAEVTVTVKLQPTATTSGNQTICALSTTASLGGNTPAGGATGAWSIVGGGTGTFNPNATTPGATFTHTGGTGPITLRWTVSNAPCTAATADVVLTIKQPPTTATVGANQTITPGGTTAPLGGNTPASGTGMWTIATPGFTGTFNPNAATPNATWTHVSGSGQVKLRWTISNPPCPDSFAEVTIQIGVPPTITCPGNITVNAAPGVCSASVSFTVTATGIPTPTITCKVGATVITSPNTFPVGSTIVTCTATNGVAPDASCSFTVTVVDTQPPVFPNGCPAGITKAAQATCPFTNTLITTYTTPIATDNCGPAPTVVCNPPSGSIFPAGTTTVTCTATDSSGNTAVCSFPINIFSFCLKDDSSDFNTVFVNALTGDYLFCQNGVPLASGKGTLVTHGCNFQIDHIKGDRKVHIQGDTSGGGGFGAGTAFIQKQGGGFVVQITDRKMTDDTCTCAPGLPPPVPPGK